MEHEYYHQSIKFNKTEPAYKKLLSLQNEMFDPTGKKYPLTTIIKMSLMAYDNSEARSK